MNLKDQLPNLGVEQNDGSLKIGNHIILNQDQWFRPDYDEFKSKDCQTEFECANILTGIANIDTVKLIVEGLDQKLEIKEKPHLHSTVTNPEWLEYFNFDCLMTDIRDMINLGVKTGNLIPIDINDSGDTALSNDANNFYFNPYVHYNVLQFLNWMGKNSFPIHDELQVGERENGTLFWLDDETQDGPIKTAKTQGIDIREIVIEYLDNTEVKITVGRNDIRTRNAEILGFHLKGGNKTWKALIGILEQPPHKYDCGPCNTKREKTEYQKKYGYLRQISKKLIENFFIKELESSLPANFSLFESVKREPGVFKPTFKVKDRSTLALCSSKSDFDFKFSNALRKAKNYSIDINAQQDLIDLIGDAKRKGYINEHQVESFDKFAIDAAFIIHKIRDDDQYDDQPDTLPQGPDCVSVENIEDYSDDTF